MSYSQNHYKVTFGGGIYGEDIWVCGVNFAHRGADTEPLSNISSGSLTAIWSAVETWFTAPATQISEHANLAWVKIAHIGKDGLYVEEPLIHDYEAAVVGAMTGVNGNIAPQNTMVCSFTTDILRGPGRFGRIYPPLNAVGVQADGRMLGSEVLGRAEQVANMLTALNAAFKTDDSSLRASVVSKVGTGTIGTIKGVRAGDVVDTQRSRRNAFKETYSVTSLVS